ncbi:MAG: ABC transporter permease subunit [Gammaproteobacteria bacterium]|nr:MAG: ABC transporter permease subunit [Gammaproteobacteria bacterium]
MVITIARKEFAEIMRDGRFRWTAALMVLLLLTSILAGWQRFAAYTAVQSTAQGESNSQWLKQGDKNPHSAAHYGNYAFKPLGPLAFFDSGITSYAGTTVFMEAHKQNFAIGRPASDTSAVARFGELNGAMILQVLLPLLIIFLGFTAFAGEREDGTLRQVLSMGVSRTSLLWGKATGLAAAVLLVVVPCLVAGGIFLAATGLQTVGGGVTLRVALLAVAYLLYAGIFLFLTLAVSAWARTARTALMIMVGFWAFTAFIMPKAATEISRVEYPVPAFGTFMAEMKAHQTRGIDGVSPYAKLGRYQAELFRKYQVSRVEDLPVYWTALRMQKLEEIDQPVFDLHYGQVRDLYLAQQRLQDRLGILAPTLPLRSVSMGLAGTSLIEHNKFTTDAEDFRHNMVFKMNDYLSKAAVDLNGVNDATNYMVANEEVFAIVPPYRYEPPALAATMAVQAGNFGILGAWLIAAVALAWQATRRMSMERS